MAAEITRRNQIEVTGLVPGSFTGNYTAASRPSSNLHQLDRLSTAAISFTNELQKAIKQNPVALKAALTQPLKIQNVPNCLPLLGTINQRIGIEGAILSLRPILYYCQFSKKTSPAPRMM